MTDTPKEAVEQIRKEFTRVERSGDSPTGWTGIHFLDVEALCVEIARLRTEQRDYIVIASGHGFPERPDYPPSLKLLTAAEAEAEAAHWITHADTIGGTASSVRAVDYIAEQHRELRRLRTELQQARADAERWRAVRRGMVAGPTYEKHCWMIGPAIVVAREFDDDGRLMTMTPDEYADALRSPVPETSGTQPEENSRE